ncbi:helix-turn-helix transcriptional regulator [Spongiivirga sp. MCCC 1A20706]|uniref:LuxR C-terminal-related transcriptional regulator n=1 Tax=Spongiivirga sp. MCCC 1A20706 TaxID=3160963 RepID=UPI00397776AD
MKKCATAILLLLHMITYAQYDFSGYVGDGTKNTTVYLSLVEDYRKVSKISLSQIIRKTEADSTGFFSFKGDNLPEKNRIYRLHTDGCNTAKETINHLTEECKDSKQILFIANNNDTIYFPLNDINEIFCQINTTNPVTDAILQTQLLKEEMLFDFAEFRSDANRKINTKNWFRQFQDFGFKTNEPLAELFIYDFLSDKRNDTYPYYLKDLSSNDYYKALQLRLEEKYPNEAFTKLYVSEIATDTYSLTLNQNNDEFKWNSVIYFLLFLSIAGNLILLLTLLKIRKKRRSTPFSKLTKQEEKIFTLIQEDKTNKEIASEIFVSVSTVKTHINNLYKKLNVQSREEIKSIKK